MVRLDELNGKTRAFAERQLGQELEVPKQQLSDAVFDIFVPGIPATQGSKRSFVVKRRDQRFVAVTVDDNKPMTLGWRSSVQTAAIQAWKGPPLSRDVAVLVGLAFYFPWPSSKGALRQAEKRGWYSGRADMDKLERAIFDALTGIVISDDGQIVGRRLIEADGILKRYGNQPGARIVLWVL